MGTTRVCFLFSGDFPAMEALLLTIYRKHQLSISCSVVRESVPHQFSSHTHNPAEAGYYAQFTLAHPKRRRIRFWQKMYSPITLLKMVMENQNLVWLITGTYQPELMDIVSTALIELGGARED